MVKGLILIGISMEFKDDETHIAFIVGTCIILFSVSMLLFIPNYLNLPKISEDHGFIFGVDNFYDPRIKTPFDWSISLDDGKISNLENSIIWVFMLWGFLRLIDIMRFLEKYK